MMSIKLIDDQLTFHTADGLTATGPGYVRKMRETLRSPFKIFVYSYDDGPNGHQTGHHLGTYSTEADADREMELINRAVDARVSHYYMSETGTGSDDPEASSDAVGADGKKYPSNQKRNREKIIMAIANNPTASNRAIAKMTGSSPHTVQKCRDIFNQNQSGKE